MTHSYMQEYVSKLIRASTYVSINIYYSATTGAHVTKKSYFWRPRCDVIVFLSYFSQKRCVLEILFCGEFLCIPSQESRYALFMRS